MKIVLVERSTDLTVLRDILTVPEVAESAARIWPHSSPKDRRGLFGSDEMNIVANLALQYFREMSKPPGNGINDLLAQWADEHPKQTDLFTTLEKTLDALGMGAFPSTKDLDLSDVTPEFRIKRMLEVFERVRLQSLAEDLQTKIESSSISEASEAVAAYTPLAATAAAPVVEDAPWPTPPRDEAFAGLAGEVVAAIEPHTEADRTALLVQFLVAAGNAMGRSPFYRVESTRHGTAEFAVIVGETSKGRKGTSWGQIQNLMALASSSWSDHHIQHGGLSSGEGLIWRFKKRRKGKDDGSDPGDVDDKRLLVLESEFASVLKQLERQGNTLSAVVRAAWDGVPLSILTKNAPMSVRDTHISLIGHVTSIELQRYLQATETANGFGNRILWVCSRRSKKLPEGGAIDAEVMGRLAEKLRKVLCVRRCEMKRNRPAREVWCEAYDALSEGKPGMAGAMLGRSEAHVTRLSLIYACLDNSTNIQSRHIRSALALWDYCERSVLHIFGTSLGDPTADKIMNSLRAAGSAGMTRYEIHRGFGANKNSADVGRALGMLEKLKLAKQTTDSSTGGRPAERWTATR